jgi:hypothetical protein
MLRSLTEICGQILVFVKNQAAITGNLHEYVDALLSAEETVLGIPVWGIHSHLCKQRKEFLVSFIPTRNHY